MSIITQIVDRCHVAETYVQVLRFVISRFREGKATWKVTPRPLRRKLISEIIQRHKANRQMYTEVMC